MVAKLMKYEFLRTRRWLAIMTLFATLVTVAGALVAATRWPIVSALGAVLAGVSVGAYLMVVQIGLAFDYWRSSYGKTGYFTHSLPVKGATIYWCKLLWGCLVTLVASAWNVVLALIAYFGIAAFLGNERPLTDLRTGLAGFFQQVSPGVVTGAVIASLILAFTGIVQYYFAASIGSEARLNRFGIGGPILVIVGLYLLTQLVLFLGILAVPLGLEITATGARLASFNFFELMTSGQDGEAMPLGFVPVLLAVTAALMWRTVISWKHKVSLT